MSAVHQNTSSGLASKVHFMVCAAHSKKPPVLCCTPFGLPVEPDVYKMNSGCSALTHSGSHVSASCSTSSCIHRSRPSCHCVLPPVRLYTITLLTASQPPAAIASSAMLFNGNALPPRICSSAVMSATAPTSTSRSLSDFDENPPNTTECVAPMRAQACMATTPSIDIGM